MHVGIFPVGILVLAWWETSEQVAWQETSEQVAWGWLDFGRMRAGTRPGGLAWRDAVSETRRQSGGFPVSWWILALVWNDCQLHRVETDLP